MDYQIEARTLHFRQPAGTSRGVYTTRRVWYVTLSDGEHRGMGECAPLPRLSADDLPNYEEVLHRMCRMVCQQGAIDTEALRPYPSMLFALECAWNQLHGTELAPQTFLQGEVGIPINGLIWMGSYDEMLTRLEEKMEAGFRCIKLKIGAINFDDECRLLERVRQRFSRQEVELRVDANGAFSPEEALQKLQRLAAFDLHSIEQPIRQGQWDAMAQLTDKTPLPIALDEELIGVNQPADKARLLDAIRPQYIILKPSLHGGLSGCDEWVRLAEERDIGWWATSALESNVGLTAIAHWCAAHNPCVPQGLGTGLLFTDNTPAHTVIRGDKLYAI